MLRFWKYGGYVQRKLGLFRKMALTNYLSISLEALIIERRLAHVAKLLVTNCICGKITKIRWLNLTGCVGEVNASLAGQIF